KTRPLKPGTDCQIEFRLIHIIFFHGGAWVLGNLDTHDCLCRILANESGCRLISVDYQLAPEHPFPAAVEDASAGPARIAAHTAELNIDPTRLAVAGDPAGGTLAAALCVRVRKVSESRLHFRYYCAL